MKLYDFAFSTNCRKVRALAYELGIPLEFVSVDLPKGAQRTPAFLAVNPNGRVPVLVDGDLRLTESQAILAYLGEKTGRLWPSSAAGSAGSLPMRSTGGNGAASGAFTSLVTTSSPIASQARG